MQGVANQRTIHAQHSYDYSVSQIKNPKSHQVLGWQVAVTGQGQGSSQTGASEENPAYILQISNKDENGNDVLNQFYKDNGINPDNVDQTKLEVHQVDEEANRIACKPLDDAEGKAFLGGYVENQIKAMLNPFSKYADAKDNFEYQTHQLCIALNGYSQFFGSDTSYYKELTDKLDTIDPDHQNSVVSYIKDLIGISASGQRIGYDDKQIKTAGKAFDDCFGGLSLADAKKKGNETSKAFTKALGESSIDKFMRIWSESKSTKEIMNDLIKAFNLSDKEDTAKTATSTSASDVGLLANQQTSKATDDESNEQMATLRRQLDETPVGNVVDVEM